MTVRNESNGALRAVSTCPVCGKPRTRSPGGYWRVTCGSAPCIAELRSAASRGKPRPAQSLRLRGPSNPMRRGARIPNWGGTEIKYNGAHERFRKLPILRVCAHSDGACTGRLMAAFKHDAPLEFVRQSVKGSYYVGPNPADGYMWLCPRHHKLYDLTDENRASMSRAQQLSAASQERLRDAKGRYA